VFGVSVRGVIDGCFDFRMPWNGFAQVDMQVYGVSIDVTLGRHNGAARRSEAIDVVSIHSASERSRYLVEITRGYLRRGADIVVVHLSQGAAGVPGGATDVPVGGASWSSKGARRPVQGSGLSQSETIKTGRLCELRGYGGGCSGSSAR